MHMTQHELTAPSSAAGKRLDVFISTHFPETSRSRIQHLIDESQITVDGRARPAGFKLRGGELISVTFPEPPPTTLVAQTIPLEIVFEDDYLIVLNKQPGLVVHPGAGRADQTLVNALLAHAGKLSSIGAPSRPGIVHRLDKDTSGLMMVAKEDTAHLALTRMIEARQVERRYLALVWGVPRQHHFSIQAPIGRKPSDRKQMAVITSGHAARQAQTDITLQESFGEVSLLEAKLATGRTHQVRVHLAFLGHPIVGDPTYGRRAARAEAATLDHNTRSLIDDLPGQALHAYRLAFTHPITGVPLQFQVDPPERFARLLAHLRFRQAARS